MSLVQRARIGGLAVASLAASMSVALPWGIAQTAPHTGMMRFPDVSGDQIVFVYANDLWIVPRDGGAAAPLAGPPGQENFPRFSADGQTIAFVGNYEGDRDLYTIPTAGGVARRVTHHPAGELLSDWGPNGELIFASNGMSGLGRAPKLFTVGADGGLPEALPVPYGVAGVISADGQWLAYTPHNRDTRTWKRYRGGMASDIWLFNLNTNESKKITDWEGTDTQPMWHGDSVYYLSDGGPEHRLNLWMHDTASGRNRQVTRFTDYDVKWPSIGPGPNGQGEIVFENGGNLYLFNLQTNQSQTVEVTIPGDRPKLRPQTVDASEYVQSWDISSTGKRAVVQARGDVWTLPAENGSPRNLTNTDGAAERMPTWSPDGRWIAYFSDATGEYELYVTQSDGKGETKQLTSDNGPFKSNISWSPNSETILFGDKAGRYYLLNVESGETSQFDRDPWGDPFPGFSFSHDNRWIAYARATEQSPLTAIFVYDTENDELHQLTSGMFSDNAPTFDRTGDWMFFSSQRNFNSPTYGTSGVDTTFAYTDTSVMMAVPLRTEDFESPWLPESDEETWDEETDDEGEEGAVEEGDEEAGDNEGDEGDDEAAQEEDEPAPDDGLSGTWQCTANTPDMGDVEFTLVLTLGEDGSTVTGTFNSVLGGGPVTGNFDKASGTLTLTATIENGPVVTFNLTVSGNSLTGTGTAEGQDAPVNGTRSSNGGDEDEGEGGDLKARELVEIVIDGFEARAIQLPVPPGQFGSIAVNDKNHVIYGRQSNGIMLFDMEADDRAEKTVAAGNAGFIMSADGKKLLVPMGGSAQIMNASAGASGKNVITDGMTVRIDPREEWAQLLRDAWRIERDFFYVANLHGVDWDAVYERYSAMLEDAASREDVGFIIGEMIAELNVGHAYYGGGDMESQPSRNVGMLGVDFEIDNGAYRIAKVYEGGAWDADARNPLREPGVDVNEGDYLLAVNGMELTTDVDPWQPFIGAAGRVTTLTVSATPEMNDEAREVLVKPMGGENQLRYRAWIEENRAYVEEQTDGQVGYIYVPNTGVNGQNDLFRQFFGQMHKKALIIDERWNGGGQIPTRFIELLNRPTTNYWARRDGKDWHWPPDSHQGPKCMLINGMAGSGGDMFPWLFKQTGLGPLIGMRTWGGLVGISGNPGLIDGGNVTAPTFGFYETDGTWGVEGHGTDPDIEVVDDPALMVDGGDPQLDAAIEIMLQQIAENPYQPPLRPSDPDRSGMGVTDEDK